MYGEYLFILLYFYDIIDKILLVFFVLVIKIFLVYLENIEYVVD